MGIQLSTSVRNAQLDQIETTISTSPVLKIFSGSMPANCAAANTGTTLVTMTLPSDWMANASGGTKAKSGTWTEASADATGTAGYFRIFDSTATTCHLQGTVSGPSGSGDLKLDEASGNVTIGQTVTVSTFTLTAGNA